MTRQFLGLFGRLDQTVDKADGLPATFAFQLRIKQADTTPSLTDTDIERFRDILNTLAAGQEGGDIHFPLGLAKILQGVSALLPGITAINRTAMEAGIRIFLSAASRIMDISLSPERSWKRYPFAPFSKVPNIYSSGSKEVSIRTMVSGWFDLIFFKAFNSDLLAV